MIKSRQDKKLTMLCGKRLRAARQKYFKGPATEFARQIGVKESTYTSHENGTRSYTAQDALKYAKHLRGVTASYLMGTANEAPDTEVPVMAAAALAAWFDKSLDNKQSKNAKSLPIPNPQGDPVRFAVEVKDESINKLIANGDYAVCVPMNEDELESGLFIYIECARGNLVQKSIRRVGARTKTGFQLKTFSTLPEFDVTIAYPAHGKDETIVVMGRVVAHYGEVDRG